VGEQHLCGLQAVFAEGAFICLAQPHLADGGGGLQLVHRFRTLAPAQALAAFGNGATGNQHHLFAATTQFGDFRRPAGKRGVVEALAVVGYQAGADFDHDARGCVNHRLHPNCFLWG